MGTGLRSIVPAGNVNTAQVNDPAVNRRLDSAASILDPGKRAQSYGRLDRDLTGQAYYITWLWGNQVSFSSKNVQGVQSKFNGGAWDLTFTSLK